MKHYFDIGENYLLKEGALTFPNKYAFWISYYDAQLKQLVWLDHRQVPVSIVKEEKHLKGDHIIITISLGTTVYKFNMEYLDWSAHINAERTFAGRVAQHELPNEQTQFIIDDEAPRVKLGLGHTKKDLINYVAYLQKQGLTHEQIEKGLPGYKKIINR